MHRTLAHQTSKKLRFRRLLHELGRSCWLLGQLFHLDLFVCRCRFAHRIQAKQPCGWLAPLLTIHRVGFHHKANFLGPVLHRQSGIVKLDATSQNIKDILVSQLHRPIAVAIHVDKPDRRPINKIQREDLRPQLLAHVHDAPNVGPFVLIEPEGLCDVGVTVLNNPLRFKAEPGRRFSQDTVQQV